MGLEVWEFGREGDEVYKENMKVLRGIKCRRGRERKKSVMGAQC